MELVVVDTNIFINALFGKGFFKSDERILDLEQEGKIKFGFSKDTLNELYKILSRRINDDDIYECYEFFAILDQIVGRSKYIEKAPRINQISSDKGDQFFIELAITIGAKYLITNDHQNGLIRLGKYQETYIVTPGQFLKIYHKENKRNTR